MAALHVADLFAFWIQAAQQNPVVVNCPASAPEPWVKWLLPTIVQTVISLVAIGSGVWIALWSFKKNWQSEHEQWLRDQKMAEWKELIQHISSFDLFFPDAFLSLSKNESRTCIDALLRSFLLPLF